MLFGSTAVVVMFIKCIEDSVFKAIFAVVTVLFSIAAAALSVYALIQTIAFGETLYAVGPASPDGTYEYCITYRESGLITEGETFVYATDKTESGAFVGKLKNKPLKIYTGGTLEYDHLSVEWLDSETLLINSGTYKVSAQEEAE